MQVVAGPRQVGKTTLVRQALERLQQDVQPMAQHSASADGPGLQGQVWLSTQRQVARALAAQAGACVLVLDEIQKVSNWTEEVKRLWDEDTAAERDVRVVILGSTPNCWPATSRTAAATPFPLLEQRPERGGLRAARWAELAGA